MYRTKAAVWLVAKWRPDLLTSSNLLDHDAFEEMRARGGHSGGEGVMLDLIAALAYGHPFPLHELDRLDSGRKELALLAIECAAGAGPLAGVDEYEIAHCLAI